MRVTFLGTGTSQGVPMIGCDCAVCLSSDPRNQRFRTHIHVQIGDTNIQVDAAPEFRLQAIRHRIPKVDLFVLTHGHADHLLGMDDLRRYCDFRNGAALPVYSNEEGEERLRSVFEYAIRDKPAIRGYPAFNPLAMPPVLEFEGGRLRSTRQSHGRFETIGLVFEDDERGKRFAYYTDCDSVSQEGRELAAGADVLVLDALRSAPHPSHMSIGEAVAEAERIKSPATYLIHMTHEIDHGKAEAKLPEGIRFAYDNLVLEL